MTASNSQRQQDEFLSLSYIYADSEVSFPSKTSIAISFYPLHILTECSPEYPDAAPPKFFLHPNNEAINQELQSKMKIIWNGSECLMGWVEAVRECADALLVERASRNSAVQSEPTENAIYNIKEFEIFQSEPISDRKSVFIAYVAQITSVEEVQQFMQFLSHQFPKTKNATHNIMAYRVKNAQNPAVLYQDYDEDGETAAGGRLLRLLELINAVDVVVVVSRWYGGILLGPDRFRHINNAAKEAMEIGGIIKNKG